MCWLRQIGDRTEDSSCEYGIKTCRKGNVSSGKANDCKKIVKKKKGLLTLDLRKQSVTMKIECFRKLGSKIGETDNLPYA